MDDVFDWPGVLRRINGNAGLARRLLTDFFADHLPLRIAAGHGEDVRRLVHRIGGSAGNLGLTGVAAAARACEVLLLSGSPPDGAEWRSALDRLETCIRVARDGVDAVLAGLPEDSPAEGRAGGEYPVSPGTLAALLADNDLAALAAVERWHAAASPSPCNDDILEAVRALDFTRAASLLAVEEGDND